MSDEKIRIVVVDDHALFRKGLVGLLSDMDEFEVVGEASNGKDALEVITRAKPDLVLLDVNMPVMDGVDTVKSLRGNVECRIVMLTISQQHRDLIGAIQAGADGYLLKNVEPDDLRNAIFQVMEDKSVISPEVTRQVFRVVGSSLDSEAVAPSLTPRELDVLRCLVRGQTTTQISESLYVSNNTVKTHVRKILEKMKASNRTEAVSKAIQLGIVDSSE